MSERTDIVKKEELALDKSENVSTVTPLVDVYENDHEILLHADMPGVQKEDIAINIDNGKLTLSGLKKVNYPGAVQWEEFGTVRYQRGFSVPQSIDTEKINAVLNDGVLRLHLPKSEAAKPKTIEIKAG